MRLQPDTRALAEAAPLIASAIPFGLIVGLAITEEPISNTLGWASSWIVFAGASQLAMITLLGSSVWSAIAAALVINSRHVMYSAALARQFQAQPRWFRWLGPYVLIDQVFALVTLRPEATPEEFRRYYLTAGVAFWSIWQCAVALGLVIGPVIPDSWHINFAAPVMFAGMVVMQVSRRPALAAAIVGAGVCFATIGLPNRTGILIGALAGITAGAIVDERG